MNDRCRMCRTRESKPGRLLCSVCTIRACRYWVSEGRFVDHIETADRWGMFNRTVRRFYRRGTRVPRLGRTRLN